MGTTGLSITLANSIIGVGILAMPFCFQQCGVVLATLILVFMGLISRLCCYFLLKSALLARRRNFEFLGFLHPAFHVFGPAGKLAVEVGIIGFLMGTCIAYFVVVGDLGPQIIAKMFNINQSDILRTSIMVVVSLVCVLPLGLLRNVDSLSNVCAATICFYFCLVMKVIAEATTQLVADDWTVSHRVVMWKPSGVLQCVPIFSMALFCQTQLFEIFESLPSLSLEKMSLVTKNAINICTAVYFTLGVFGYIAFSSHTISGNILMSLSPTMASDVIKLGFVMSVACSFPLIIFPCRASLYSLLYRKGQSTHHDHLAPHAIPESTFRRMTVCIVAAALGVSLLIPNIELVLGLVGSTIGVAVCLVFPAACFVNVTFKDTNERVLAKGVLILGLIIMVLGTCANLQAAEHQPDKYDGRTITQERIDQIVEDFFEAKRLHKDDVMRNPDIEHEAQKEIVTNVENPSKDSEFQPPNPEPPKSQSVEKTRKTVVVKKKHDKKEQKETPAIKETIQRPEEPPIDGNVNPQINDAGVINGASNLETQEEIIKKHENKLQEKIVMIKQQQLIDTIKQHGVEQKELIKEQKEILHEIKKTKDELKQNKKDADSKETKKIAVESIQKIANLAIQSLNGVTDKPIDNPVEVQDPIEIVEIAKKAVESIAAIQEKVKDKEEIQNVGRENVKNVPVVQSLPVQSNAEQNMQPNDQNVRPVVPQLLNKNIQVADQNNAAQMVVNKNDEKVLPEIPDQKKQNTNDNAKQIDEQKPHSHAPDEPQSYKQGEDLQADVKPSNGIDQNLPLAVAMNNNAKTNGIAENKIELPKTNDAINTIVQNGEINNADQPHVRQKREVVDCTERNTLKPEDKQICDTLVSNPEDKVSNPEEMLLSKVDLNDALSNRLPINANMIHRSLKSVDSDEVGR